MKSRKNLIIIALVVLVSVVGLSYAFFNYYQVSQRNLQLITGEIYLRLDDGTDEVMLLNAFPETREEARSRDDNYITFTITGKNTTTNKDIHYEIDLNEGDPVAGRTRLKASDLRFDLVEIRGEDEVYVVWDESFENFDEKRIWVDHVFKNTTEEVERVYKLRMWISEDVLISDTDPNASYTTGEYKNSYASVKVSVFGDFNEKATDAACFTTEIYGFSNMEYKYIAYDKNITDETIVACKTAVKEALFNYDLSDDRDGYQKVCEGTGTVQGMTIDSIIKSPQFEVGQKLKDANYLINYNEEVRYYSLNTSAKSVNTCKNYISTNYSSLSLDLCSDQDLFGENILIFTNEDMDYFEENGILTSDEGKIPTALRITDYDASCGSEVFIPTTINNVPIIAVDKYDEDGFVSETGAFENKGLEKVVIPSSVGVGTAPNFKNNHLRSIVIPYKINSAYKRVGKGVYADNNLEYVYIPEGIITTGIDSFRNNRLVKVDFPETLLSIDGFGNNELVEIDLPGSLEQIGYEAFANNKLSSLDIPSSVTYIGAGAFNNNQLSDDEAFIYARTDADDDGVAEIDNTLIISYAGSNKNVTIPTGVIEIGRESFRACELESVTIPEGITTISYYAFYENAISDITIPNSVISIGQEALVIGEQLKTITIGNGITYIDRAAFNKKNPYSSEYVLNSNLTSITINKTCAEIKAIQASSTDTIIYYPWLNSFTPYTAEGVTIYGANGEVCDTY